LFVSHRTLPVRVHPPEYQRLLGELGDATAGPYALAEALAWKHGFRDEDTAKAVAGCRAQGSKFSLLDSGILDRPASLLLRLNGMEDSIFPIEDSILVALSGGRKEIHARSGLRHMGNPGGEEILYDWLDRQVANHA
jgi:hypothetical protein